MINGNWNRISLLATLATVSLALQGQTKTIDVNEPRPLWSALDQIETANPGVAINYEDPPYTYQTDVQDSATAEQQAAHPGFHLIVPKAGHITAQVTSPSVTQTPVSEVVGNVSLLLANYRQNGLPGDFKIEQRNGAVYVTPIMVLGTSGSPQTVSSPMTTLITIPTSNRSVPDTIQAVFDSISKATDLHIGIATLPFRPTDRITFGADNEPARDALARLFAMATTGPISYRLLFEPLLDTHRAFDYMVNIHRAGYVPPHAPAGLGPMGPTPAAPQAPNSAPRQGQPEPFKR